MTDNYYIVTLWCWNSNQYSFVEHGHSPKECAEKLGLYFDAKPENGYGYIWCDGRDWDRSIISLNGRWESLTKIYGIANLVYAYYPCTDELTEYLMYLDANNIKINSISAFRDNIELGTYVSFPTKELVTMASFIDEEGQEIKLPSVRPKISAWLDAYALVTKISKYENIIEKIVEDLIIHGNQAYTKDRIQLIQRITASIIRAEEPALKRMLNWMITDLKHSNDENIVADVERTYNAVCNVYPELVEQETETN